MSSENRMSFRLLNKFVETELESILEGHEQEFSYLVEGPHGIGKSAFWKEMCILYNGYFVDLRLGQRDLGDIIGLPTIITDPVGVKHMIHIKPELVRKMFVKDLSELGVMGDDNDRLSHVRPPATKGKSYDFILGFLDEYNRGTKDVQQAVFELVYDRSMNGDRIHPKVMLAAACNDNLEIYTITEADPAFRSRFKTIKYTPTVDEWLSWGKSTGELCPEVMYVIKTKKDLADPPKLDIGKELDFLNKPHPNRRSWHEFSKWYARFKSKFSDNEIKDICSTFVGADSAEIFKQIVAEMKTTKERTTSANNAETVKIETFFKQFIAIHKMNYSDAENELATFSASDYQALADYCIRAFDEYTYITGVTKERIKSLSQLIPDEVFAKIWNTISDQFKFKQHMKSYMTLNNAPNYFDKYEVPNYFDKNVTD